MRANRQVLERPSATGFRTAPGLIVVVTVGLIAVVIAAAGCSASTTAPAVSASTTVTEVSTPTTPTPAPTTPTSSEPDDARIAGWRSDLALLLPAMEAKHPDLFHGTPRQDFETAIAALDAAVPTATDDELMVGVMRTVALVSAKGRDGHTGAFVWGSGDRPLHSLPLRLWLFPDGLYVVDALPPYTDLIGTRVTSIAGRPTADVLAAIDPLVPRDNPETVTLLTPRFVLIPEVLHGLDLIDAPAAVPLDVTGTGGTAISVTVDPIPMADYNVWAGPYGLFLPARPNARFLARMDEPLWTELIPASGTLYVQYNRVDGVSSATVASLRTELARPEVRQVVLDLRHNFGGELRAIRPVLDALESMPTVRLSVITGRNTFSGGVLVAAELERTLRPVFVGEPMGGSPNFFANPRDVVLPHSGIVVNVSTAWYIGSTAEDQRLEIEPDLAVALTASDYFADADPALEVAITGQLP